MDKFFSIEKLVTNLARLLTASIQTSFSKSFNRLLKIEKREFSAIS